MAQRVVAARSAEPFFLGERLAIRFYRACKFGCGGIDSRIRSNFHADAARFCGAFDRVVYLLGGDDSALVLQRPLLPGAGPGWSAGACARTAAENPARQVRG